jgi:hypothetical protein
MTLSHRYRSMSLRYLPRGGRFLGAASLLAVTMGLSSAEPTPTSSGQGKQMTDHPYVGMWVTEDGYIRHNLLANNRYDEARGNQESAYRGRYEITGNRIEYWDDTGFTADGEFRNGVLYHAGMIFRRPK